jgi:TorA maturation chaperone TorD
MGALEKIPPDGNIRQEIISDKTRLVDLQNEYVRLFINSLPEVPCVPYGSFYLEGVIMGPSTIGLKQLYQAYGFETSEPADHVAVELEFLAFLSHMMGKAADDGALQTDYEFVLDHLKAWTPEFFKRVQQNDKSGFYRKISEYTGRLVGG